MGSAPSPLGVSSGISVTIVEVALASTEQALILDIQFQHHRKSGDRFLNMSPGEFRDATRAAGTGLKIGSGGLQWGSGQGGNPNDGNRFLFMAPSEWQAGAELAEKAIETSIGEPLSYRQCGNTGSN